MAFFEYLNKKIDKYFNKLVESTEKEIIKKVEKAKLPKEAKKNLRDIDNNSLRLKYFTKHGLENMANLEKVKERYNSLKLKLKNFKKFENTFEGLDESGNSFTKVTFENSLFTGTVYKLIQNKKFKVIELAWIRSFKNGELHGESENYSFNRLISRISYFEGKNILEEHFEKTSNIQGPLILKIEYESETRYKKIVYDFLGNFYEIQSFNENLPNGEWLEYSKDYGSDFYLSKKKYYKNGLEDNKWETYDKYGKVIEN